MSELGRQTGYPTSALTGIVDRMIRKKLVRRIRDDNDRRIVKVTATSSGLKTRPRFSSQATETYCSHPRKNQRAGT